jgi:hypothetical protein
MKRSALVGCFLAMGVGAFCLAGGPQRPPLDCGEPGVVCMGKMTPQQREQFRLATGVDVDLSRPIRIGMEPAEIPGDGTSGTSGCGAKTCSVSCTGGECHAGPCAAGWHAVCGCNDATPACWCWSCD